MHDRRGVRRRLGAERERVGLEQPGAVAGADLELVAGALRDLGHEQLPDAGRAHRPHRVQPAVPRVEVADHRDAGGLGSPDDERDARDPAVVHRVRAHPLPELLVAALAREVEVEVSERREERVRVAHGERLPVRVGHLEQVLERLGAVVQARLEHAAVPVGHRQLAAEVRDHVDLHRVGPERADHQPVAVGVDPEQRVGIAVGEGSDLVQRLVDLRAVGGLSQRDASISINAFIGICTQSGRLCSS